MFGYREDEKTVYENSVSNFNQYLKNEFSGDYRKLVVNIGEKTYQKRDYYNILNEEDYSGYKDGKNPVVELREDTIGQLFQMLDTPRKST